MTDTKDWVLPNGGTFLASTAGIYGSWAKATDPVTAARDAAKANSSSYPQFVPSGTCQTKRQASPAWAACRGYQKRQTGSCLSASLS